MTPTWFDRWLSAQAARPHGVLAWAVGRWLERENAEINAHAVAILAAQPGESILEVGCGSGWALAQLAQSSPGQLAAVDVAPAMVRQARRRSRALRAIARDGRLRVACAPAEHLPFAPASFDAALAVNAMFFWRPPVAALREMYRVLRPAGRAVIAVETPDTLAEREADASQGFETYDAATLVALCREAGFDVTHVEERPMARRLGVLYARLRTGPR